MDWRDHEINELLQILQNMHENAQTKSYKASEAGIDWEIISSKLEGKGPEECKSMYHRLVVKVRKYRTMPEILSDAMTLLKTNGLRPSPKKIHPDMPKKPVTAFGIFVRKKSKKFPGMTGRNLMSLLSKKWSALSEQKKESYRQKYVKRKEKYEEEMEEFRKNHPDLVAPASSSRPQPPQPCKLFVESRIEKMKLKHPELGHPAVVNKLIKKYEGLSDQKKLKWINKAKQQMQSYQEQYQAYLAQNPTVSLKPAVLHLSKEEQRILNMSLGKPVNVPPKNLFLYFCNTQRSTVSHLSIAEQSHNLSSAYHGLSKEELQELDSKFKQDIEEYVESYKQFYQSLGEEEKQNEKPPDEALAGYMTKLKRKNVTTKEAPPAKKKKKLGEEDELQAGNIDNETDNSHVSETAHLPLENQKSPSKSKSPKASQSPAERTKGGKSKRVSQNDLSPDSSLVPIVAASLSPQPQKSPSKKTLLDVAEDEDIFRTQKSPRKSKITKGSAATPESTPTKLVTVASEDLLAMWSPLTVKEEPSSSQENGLSSPSKKEHKSAKKSKKAKKES